MPPQSGRKNHCKLHTDQTLWPGLYSVLLCCYTLDLLFQSEAKLQAAFKLLNNTRQRLRKNAVREQARKASEVQKVSVTGTIESRVQGEKSTREISMVVPLVVADVSNPFIPVMNGINIS